MLIAVGAVGMVAMVIWFHVWQDRVRDLMGVAHLKWFDYPLAAALSLIVLFAVVEIGQLVGRLIRFLDRQLDRVAPPRVSAVIVVFLLVALTIALLNGVVVKFAMRTMNNTFATVNNETSPTSARPKTPNRSGGPESLVSWESLGHQGRIFVGNGPTVDQLTKFNGAPATEPIRAYAGLNSADGITATAELAARELQRTGGLRRAVIAVGTTTGTGWINEAEADALEYMYNGNTAIVSMQYSFLPSWLSFLVDKNNARHAGQALFEAVDRLVRQLPEAQRPKLVVFGESLGSFGGEAPFMSLNNVLARTDGALFSGPTFQNTIWTDLTATRDRRLTGMVADLRPRKPRAVRGPSRRPGPPQRRVAPAASGVSATRIRPHRLVESRPAVPPAGLVARKTRLRRASRDRVDPGGDVLAGVGRHGGGDRRTGRPRSRLCGRRGQRLGGGAAAAGVDAGEDRQAAPPAARQRRLTASRRVTRVSSV